jgi:predicted membrane protein
MNNAQSPKLSGKVIALVGFVAIATAVVTTLIQRLVWTEASVAVTGGVTGAIAAVVAIAASRDRSVRDKA